MQGFLLVPPDRATIIARKAAWKHRFVILDLLPQDLQPQQQKSANVPITPCLSIYKSKNDQEPAQSYAISSIASCQVQIFAHRKNESPLPTLLVNLSPESSKEKLRKRRSSRSAGLASSRDSTPLTLYFRAAGDDQYTLDEWASYIQSHLSHLRIGGPNAQSPLTPVSPNFSLGFFSNPFSTRPREDSNGACKSTSINTATTNRDSSLCKTSSQVGPMVDRDWQPTLATDSPSLRSRRSDVSSHNSVMHPHPLHIATQNRVALRSADYLPSPPTTISESQGEATPGWPSSSRTRSSFVGSPVRGTRNSASSQINGTLASQPPSADSTAPPVQRETILDRAFQMRLIPGLDSDVVGDEKLNSLARFDALMREADEKRKRREEEEGKMVRPPAENNALKGAWDLDDSEDDKENGDVCEEDNYRYDSHAHQGPSQMAIVEDSRMNSRSASAVTHANAALPGDVTMSATTQRALDLIVRRHEPLPPSSSSSIPHDGPPSTHITRNFPTRNAGWQSTSSKPLPTLSQTARHAQQPLVETPQLVHFSKVTRGEPSSSARETDCRHSTASSSTTSLAVDVGRRRSSTTNLYVPTSVNSMGNGLPSSSDMSSVLPLSSVPKGALSPPRGSWWPSYRPELPNANTANNNRWRASAAFVEGGGYI